MNRNRVRVAHVESYLDDIEEHEASTEAEGVSNLPVDKTTDAGPDSSSVGDVTSGAANASPDIRDEQAIDGPQKVMFERMSEVASTYCTTTTVAKVDVTELLVLQDRLTNAWRQEHDVEPSLTAFASKAVAERLPKYPELNAELVDDRRLRLFEDINVGIAVNSDDGLLVLGIFRFKTCKTGHSL